MKNGNKIRGIAGTIIFHILLLLVLIFFGLSTPLPLPGEEGVEVNLGYTDEGMGYIQQSEPPKATPPAPPQEIKEEVKEEEIITQETEETPAITKPKNDDIKDIPDKEIKEKPEVIEKIPEKPKVDPRALYTGKSKSTNNGSNEGKTVKSGDQGNKFGVKDIKIHDGSGGSGSGVSFDLGGRGAKHLPEPKYTSPEQGKVVVTIYVNKQGQVTKAYSGAKGTTIADLQLRKLAKEAALRAKFNPDLNAPETQKGTITYNFIRLK